MMFAHPVSTKKNVEKVNKRNRVSSFNMSQNIPIIFMDKFSLSHLYFSNLMRWPIRNVKRNELSRGDNKIEIEKNKQTVDKLITIIPFSIRFQRESDFDYRKRFCCNTPILHRLKDKLSTALKIQFYCAFYVLRKWVFRVVSAIIPLQNVLEISILCSEIPCSPANYSV